MFKPSTATGTRSRRKFSPVAALGILAAVPLFAAGCTLGGDSEPGAADAATTTPQVEESVAPARQDHITLGTGGFEPDAVEVDEGTMVRVTNSTDATMTIVVSGGDSDTEFEIPAGTEIEIDLASPGARVITVPGDAGLTATVMVLAIPTQDAR